MCIRDRNISTEVKADQSFENHVFSWGFRLEKNKYSDQLNEYHLTDSAGYILPNNSKKFYLEQSIKLQNQIDIDNYTAHIQDSYSLTSNSDLQIGVRASYNSLSDQLLISPRLLLAYRPSSNLSLIHI